MTFTEHATRAVVEEARRSDEAGGYAGVNVAPSERIVSLAGGLAATALGLKQQTLGGLALAVAGGYLAYRGLSGYCPAYDALGLDSAHEGHALTGGHDVRRGVRVRKSFTVNRSPGDCYGFWRKLDNLPTFMTHLKSVEVRDETHSRWEAKAPLGRTVAWDAEIFEDKPDELIAWKSVGDADIDNAGSVRFRPAPGGRGTEVTVTLQYMPPAGRVGAALAWLLGEEPDAQVREDLRHFKQVMEAGEIPTTAGQPACRDVR